MVSEIFQQGIRKVRSLLGIFSGLPSDNNLGTSRPDVQLLRELAVSREYRNYYHNFLDGVLGTEHIKQRRASYSPKIR